MHLYYIAYLELSGKGADAKAKVISSAKELSSYSVFQRGTIEEFMSFLSGKVAERTPSGQRNNIQFEENSVTVFVDSREGGHVAVVITDSEYPVRVAFQLAAMIIEDHSEPSMVLYITKFQDPRQVDRIMKVQEELDETKIVVHKTIESVLNRGEKLNELVDRSEALSAQSKMFYKTAKRQNSCCVIM